MVKRKLVYMCETCGKTEKDFTSKKNFFEHLQSSIHTNERFKCDQCDLDFQYLKGLNRHKSSIHEAQIFKCESCGLECSTKSNLSRHIATNHGITQVFLASNVKRNFQIMWS